MESRFPKNGAACRPELIKLRHEDWCQASYRLIPTRCSDRQRPTCVGRLTGVRQPICCRTDRLKTNSSWEPRARKSYEIFFPQDGSTPQIFLRALAETLLKAARAMPRIPSTPPSAGEYRLIRDPSATVGPLGVVAGHGICGVCGDRTFDTIGDSGFARCDELSTRWQRRHTVWGSEVEMTKPQSQ